MPHESIFIPSEKYARRAICSRRKRSPRPCVPRRRLSWRASCRPVRRSRCGRRRSTRTGQTQGGVPAILAYDGLAYKYLEAETLTAAELRFAQDSLRLFSAFYGPLRPLDAIRPYRLELAHRLDGRSLYEFWGRAFYDDLFGAGEAVVNLASNEYSKAVRRYLQTGDRMVTCEFLTYRKGKLRCLPTMAKMARGRMTRYILQHRIESPEQLTLFDWNDFRYEQSLSDNQTLTFIVRA